MTIGATRFWIDRDSRSFGVRSSSGNGSQPFEFYLNRRLRIFPDFKLYEDTDEGSNLELRLSACWLWFSLNMLVCFLPARENGHRLDDRDRTWGFYFLDNSLILRFGFAYVNWDLPFVTSQFVKSQIMSITRNRVVYEESRGKGFDSAAYNKSEEIKKEHSITLPYRYECLNGTIQDVMATIHVSRHIRRKTWSPFTRNDDSICVSFSEGVGPELGSWKGGCTGCGYTLKPKENVIACLRRMEIERRFER